MNPPEPTEQTIFVIEMVNTSKLAHVLGTQSKKEFRKRRLGRNCFKTCKRVIK